MMWFCLIVYACCTLALVYMASHAVKKTVQGISTNVYWQLTLSGGTHRNILIPRDKDPEAYIGTWMRLNPGKRVVCAVNSEDGSKVVFE